MSKPLPRSKCTMTLLVSPHLCVHVEALCLLRRSETEAWVSCWSQRTLHRAGLSQEKTTFPWAARETDKHEVHVTARSKSSRWAQNLYTRYGCPPEPRDGMRLTHFSLALNISSARRGVLGTMVTLRIADIWISCPAQSVCTNGKQ